MWCVHHLTAEKRPEWISKSQVQEKKAEVVKDEKMGQVKDEELVLIFKLSNLAHGALTRYESGP